MSDPTFTPPTQEQVAAAGTLIDGLVVVLKWLGFSAAAGWVIFKFTVRSSVKAGEELHKYETLRTDVDVLKEQSKTWLSVPAHEALQRACQGNIEKLIEINKLQLEQMVECKVNDEVSDLRDKVDVMHGNICHLMGSLNIEPLKPRDSKRRKSDILAG